MNWQKQEMFTLLKLFIQGKLRDELESVKTVGFLGH